MWLAAPFDAGTTTDDAPGSATPVALLDLDTVEPDDTRLAAALAPRPDRRAVVGVAAGLVRPAVVPLLDLLTTSLLTVRHPGPVGSQAWVAVDDPHAAAAQIVERTARRPRATRALDVLLRLTSTSPVADAVAAESTCYSMLLAGPEMRAWLADRPVRPRRPGPPSEPVHVSREADRLHVRLDDPRRRNPFSAILRDHLCDALRLALLDDTVREVVLTGEGPGFSSGGDLDEFGTAPDVATAHLVRIRQHAGLLLHQLGDRAHVVVHGHCVGAGVEVPAFAARVTARPDTTFRLPELDLGLVPGAGGTVSVTRRIGRWRTAFLVLSGRAIDADTALDWGLVDDVA